MAVESLQQVVTRLLVETGRWEFSGLPVVQWRDLTAGGELLPVGLAVQRELAYQLREEMGA